MDKYPHLARARQIIEQYSSVEALLTYAREDRQRFRFVPGKAVLSKKAIQKFALTLRLVEMELEGRFRDDDSPELTHALGVTALALVKNGIRSLPELQARATHDFMEDMPKQWPYHRLASCTSLESADIVTVCTRDRDHYLIYPNEESQNSTFFEHVGRKAETAKNKLDDGLHNLITLKGLKAKESDSRVKFARQKFKLCEAEEHLLPMAKRYKYNDKEIEQAIAWNWDRICREESELEGAPVLAEDREP